MFRKTRYRLLALNLSVTLLSLFAAFATVYLITWNSMEAENQASLAERAQLHYSIRDHAPQESQGGDAGQNAQEPNTQEMPESSISAGGIFPQSSGDLIVNSGASSPSGISLQSGGDNAEGTLPEGGVRIAIEGRDGQTSGDYSINVQAGDRDSMNIIVDGDGIVVEEVIPTDVPTPASINAAEYAWANRDGERVQIAGRDWIYSISEAQTEPDHSRITFLDVTKSTRELAELLRILLFVGLAMFAVIFFASRHFAGRAIRPLQDAWEKQRQFIADASHELKTPLAVIASNRDAVLSNPDSSVASQAEWFGYQKRGIDRMTWLIDEMLSVARLEGQAAGMDRCRFDPGKAAREEMALLESAAAARGITMTMDAAEGTCIESDERLFRKILAILLDNAIKYADEGGSVELLLQQRRHGTLLTVRNTGEGIPEKERERVFDRFYRCDPARAANTEGFGLGLSIARAAAHAMRGSLTAGSDAEGRTVFTLRLPR
jgi:signal transduction histidine kinase